MPQLISQGRIVEDHWLHLADTDPLAPQRACSVSLNRLLQAWDSLQSHQGDLGLRLTPDAQLDELSAFLPRLALIMLDFPHFTDGRAYSQAVLLRERWGYRGQLRACGDVIQDTVYYLQRCGIDTLALRDDQNVEDCLRALSTFTHPYQASVGTTMLFHRTQR